MVHDIVKQTSGIDPVAMEVAGLTTLIKETKPLTVVEPSHHPPVIEKQRAIVKPQILTHYIEGFIIQEGPEPFPVRSSLVTFYTARPVGIFFNC